MFGKKYKTTPSEHYYFLIQVLALVIWPIGLISTPQIGWAASSVLNPLNLSADSVLGVSSDNGPFIAAAVAANISDSHAKGIWGANIARGNPFLIHKEDGTPLAYVFSYALNTFEFPSYEQIFSVVRTSTEMHSLRDKQFYEALKNDIGSFGCIEVSATRSNFPVLVVRHSLHPYFLYAEMAADVAGNRLNSSEVALDIIEYSGPHELYFHFSSPKGNIQLNAYLLKTKEEMKSLAAQIEPDGSKPVPFHEIIDSRRKEAWAQIDDPGIRNLEDTVKWIDNYTLVPVVDWTHWCVPTAMTMTAGFWDYYDPRQGTWPGYGRIIDYWFDHTDHCNNNTVTNVPNVIDEIIDHSTCTWSTLGLTGTLNTTNGYNFSWTDIKGTPDNDWCWGDIVSEINAGRPAVWGVGPAAAHAMTAIGYRITGAQKFVIVYNTWGSTAEQQLAEYNYDQWGGSPNTDTGVGKLLPEGGTGLNHAILVSPRGGETVIGSTNISWFVWGEDIKWTIIQFSKDGGTTWGTVHQDYWLLPTNSGWNSYTASLNDTTAKGRIRLYCFSSILTYIAGDGSPKNFFVQGKPDLVPVSACTRNSQGDLIIKVKNQGTVSADASVTRVEFFPGGTFDLNYPSIGAGSTAEATLSMPYDCWNPDCDFQIKVDINNHVNEADEGNNTASVACFG